ncbi:MAG: aspartate/tyrosine/aromatic aminotransferase [Verrucomicrobia bacterium]|nr:MAG: aspartate/tyrosine/aromatic aminotransferase [Verrucomicrobiota bacterium]
MLENVQPAPPDAILGLTEAFRNDPNPEKINLGVGVYCDENGKTPVLGSVKQAERRILETETAKSYLPIDGNKDYAARVQALLFGAGSEIIAARRAATSQTPGGTGALRVAADFIHKAFPGATVWLSQPTWPNHPQILAAAGVPAKSYPYFDPATNALDFAAMKAALQEVSAGDVVLLHGCCHNPSGVDPSPEQWSEIGRLLVERGAIPLIDFAYQGFGLGLEEDAAGLRALLAVCPEMLIASSFSKNFGLYGERVGALTVLAQDAEAAARVQSQIKSVIRANYSNPPMHGAAIVATILGDEALREQWEGELAAMRDRINGMRRAFVETLAAKGVSRDFSFITRQLGMFSFSGLEKEQIERLRRDYSIYILGSGRINVAGITPSNIDRLCSAIGAVL